MSEDNLSEVLGFDPDTGDRTEDQLDRSGLIPVDQDEKNQIMKLGIHLLTQNGVNI